MTNTVIAEYLDSLATCISNEYNTTKEESVSIVRDSHMDKLLESDSEIIMHDPISYYAELVYKSHKIRNPI